MSLYHFLEFLPNCCCFPCLCISLKCILFVHFLFDSYISYLSLVFMVSFLNNISMKREPLLMRTTVSHDSGCAITLPNTLTIPTTKENGPIIVVCSHNSNHNHFWRHNTHICSWFKNDYVVTVKGNNDL